MLSFLIDKSLCILGYANFVFYGATDAAIDGTWVCEGTGQVLVTATGPGTGGPLFHSSQPDSTSSENCAVGYHLYDFLIADYDCNYSSYFLCEKPRKAV